MTDKEIIAVAALLASNDIHQTVIGDLLLDKGIITEKEFQARINARIEKDFETSVENYRKIICDMTRRHKTESEDRTC